MSLQTNVPSVALDPSPEHARSAPTSIAAPTLRPYQSDLIHRVRGAFGRGLRSVCMQAPTGAGKTVIFAVITHGAAQKGKRVLILGHRQEIADQICGALNLLGISFGRIEAGHSETAADVQIASVWTLIRRLDRIEPPDLIVIDECHHAVAKAWRTVLDAFPDAKVLGVTATPERLDGKGLKDVFKVLVPGPAVADLIEGGWLSRFLCYAPKATLDMSNVKVRGGDFSARESYERMKGSCIVGNAVEQYQARCSGQPAVAFCITVEHAQEVAGEFRKAGYRAFCIDGSMRKDGRRGLIQGLADGSVQVLTSCEIISEGVDVPVVSTAILLRPTKSLALHLQQCGRVLRPAPGKDKALILDHVGNVHRHGLPDTARNWSLDGRKKKPPKPPPICSVCNCVVSGLNSCPDDYEFCPLNERRTQDRRIQVVDGTLVHVEGWAAGIDLATGDYFALLNLAQTAEHLWEMRRARGYRPGWVYKVAAEKGIPL